MAEAAAALAAARKRVSGLADGLANKTTIAIFNEAQAASPARDDFRMALLTRANVPPAADYRRWY